MVVIQKRYINLSLKMIKIIEMIVIQKKNQQKIKRKLMLMTLRKKKIFQNQKKIKRIKRMIVIIIRMRKIKNQNPKN